MYIHNEEVNNGHTRARRPGNGGDDAAPADRCRALGCRDDPDDAYKGASKSKKKKEREKRRLEYQDRRMANDEEHAKVTRAMRYDVLRRDGFRCVKCGRGREDGVKLHVDHIKPVSRGGKSVMDNLQTLCEDCNCGKGNKYEE